VDGVTDGQVVASFLVWLGCFVGKKLITMGEPSEDLQYFLELQKQRNNNKEARRG